jgi:hypothetical protein
LEAVIKTELKQLKGGKRKGKLQKALAGFIALSSSKNEVYIAWRGTTLAEEWDADVDVDLVDWKDLLVHQGFYDIYTSAVICPMGGQVCVHVHCWAVRETQYRLLRTYIERYSWGNTWQYVYGQEGH